MFSTRRILEAQTARFTATQKLERTASIPDDIAFTICGWGRIVVDTNAFSTFAAIEDVTSGSPTRFVQLGTAADGTSLSVFADTATAATVRNLVAGRDFFWALTSSALTAASNIGYTRYVYEKVLTSAAMSGSARVAFTPAHVVVGNDSVGEPANARIWNVMCWGRALSAAELMRQSLYQVPQDPTALNFWWPMANGDIGRDWSENRRDATVTGTLTAEPNDVLLLNRVFPRRVLYLAGTIVSGAAASAGIGSGLAVPARILASPTSASALATGAASLAATTQAPAISAGVSAGAATAFMTLSATAIAVGAGVSSARAAATISGVAQAIAEAMANAAVGAILSASAQGAATGAATGAGTALSGTIASGAAIAAAIAHGGFGAAVILGAPATATAEGVARAVAALTIAARADAEAVASGAAFATRITAAAARAVGIASAVVVITDAGTNPGLPNSTRTLVIDDQGRTLVVDERGEIVPIDGGRFIGAGARDRTVH